MTYADFGDGVGYVYICNSATPTIIDQVHVNSIYAKDYCNGVNKQVRNKRVYLDNRPTATPDAIAMGSIEITQNLIDEQTSVLMSAETSLNTRQVSYPVKFDGAVRTYIPVFKYSGKILAIECFVTTDIDAANDGKVDVQINGTSCLTGGTPITIPMGSVASPTGFSINGSINSAANTFSVGNNMQIVTNTATTGEALLIITTRVTG